MRTMGENNGESFGNQQIFANGKISWASLGKVQRITAFIKFCEMLQRKIPTKIVIFLIIFLHLFKPM